MELDYSRKEKIVGIFIIFILVLLLSTVIILGRGKNWFRDHNIYFTTFDESYNLKVGADVKLFKTNIGKVKLISVEDKVRIKLAILAKYESRIRTDTVVTVESPTFVGSEYISIIPGSEDAPILPPESDIPSKAKKSIGDLLEEFHVEETAKKLIQTIQDVAEFTQTIKDPEGPLMAAVENINQTTYHIRNIAKGIEEGEGTMGSLLTSTLLLDTLLARLEKVGEILQYLSEASAKTPKTVDHVQDSLSRVKEIGDGLAENMMIIKRILTDIENNMPAVQTILKNTEKGSQDVPRITESVVRIIQEARDEIENVDKIIQSLQNNFLIKPNLPPEPVAESTDAGLRR